MIIQERRVSKVQRYKSKGGLCTAKGGDFSKIGARNQKIAKEVERKDFSSTNNIFMSFRKFLLRCQSTEERDLKKEYFFSLMRHHSVTRRAYK